MNKELNKSESESVIVFSQGDIQETENESLGKAITQINIPPNTEAASIQLPDQNFSDSKKKIDFPETIEERNEKSEQDGSEQDSFLTKSDKDETGNRAKTEEKV